MRIIGNAEKAREVQAVASGVLPSGQPVVVNANGTVSVVAGSSLSEGVGSASIFESANSTYLDSAFDSTNNKFIVAYQDSGNSQKGTAVVGTVSGDSISFGTPVVFQNSTIEYCAVVYDSTNNKIVVFYHDAGSTNYGKAIVGTVSGTSISFGTAVVFASVVARSNFAAFDSGNGKVVNVYRNSSANSAGDAVVGTVSGTSISFGSSTNWSPANQGYGSVTYIGSSKFLIGYTGSSEAGTARVATLSGTSLSYGSSSEFRSQQTFDISSAYDSSTGKAVMVYRDNFSNGRVAVATISGTSVSFGSDTIFAANGVVASGDTSKTAISYDSTNDKMVISYQDNSNSNYGTIIVGTVSGTSISFGTPVVFEAASTNYTTSAFDTNSGKVVIAYRDQGNSNYGTSVVFQNANVTTNLTSENYIGMSGGVVDVDSRTEEIGSPAVFESADITEISAVFDSANNKVVIAYEDRGNSNYGTAVVGTVSGTSISFGTPVVFESAESRNISATFDSNNNKVVIAYDDNGNSSYGTAVVGTVSGTSISFGSPVVFESAEVQHIGATFDSSNSKVVIAYADHGNSEYGTAIVGTVSGTSISFGSPAVFESAQTARINSTFDSNDNKVVFAYRTTTGKAVVGTVSGTSISFGTPVEFYNALTDELDIVFDSNANKVVIAYLNGAGNLGLAKVGTVSGTSISFGAEATFESAAAYGITPVFDSSVNKVVVVYYDAGNSDYGTTAVGTIDGTSITFGTPTVFVSTDVRNLSAAFDSSNNKIVTSYRDGDNSNFGTSIALQAGYTNITRGQVANGDNAEINIKGAVADNQSGLTAGQSYYVQTDGTLSTTAGDPSVFAGTAVAATKLIVKG
jgi:hypothetical protein